MKRNKKLEAIQLLYDTHSKHIEYTYNRGVVNGLALAISILTDEPPKYITDNKCFPQKGVHGAWARTPDDLPDGVRC